MVLPEYFFSYYQPQKYKLSTKQQNVPQQSNYYSYICRRFQKEITKRYTSILLSGNVRNFLQRIMRDEYNGSRNIAWTVCHIYIIQGNSHDLPTEEVVYGATLCLYKLKHLAWHLWGYRRHNNLEKKKNNYFTLAIPDMVIMYYNADESYIEGEKTKKDGFFY